MLMSLLYKVRFIQFPSFTHKIRGTHVICYLEQDCISARFSAEWEQAVRLIQDFYK